MARDATSKPMLSEAASTGCNHSLRAAGQTDAPKGREDAVEQEVENAAD
jgi:hypothetical protein